MEVRVCNKCGAENKESNEVCSSCYASLDDAKLVESTKEPVVVVNVQPRAPKPSQDGAPPPQPPPSPSGQVYDVPSGATAVGPPRQGMFEERRAPVRKESRAGAAIRIFVLLLIAGGAIAAWWFFLRTPSPEEVVQTFVNASMNGDKEKAKACLTKASFSVPGVAESFTTDFKNGGNGGIDPKSVETKIVGTVYEGANDSTAVVSVDLKPTDKTVNPTGMSIQLPFVLAKEDGQWRIDALPTQRRMVRAILSEMRKKRSGTPQGPMEPVRP